MQCSDSLLDLLQRQKELQKLYAASGAAPARVLAYEGEQLSSPISTCYPVERLRNKLPTPTDADVVIWNNVITSQGLGLVLLFAIELGQLLFEEDQDQIGSDDADQEDVGYKKAKLISRRLLIDRTGKLGFRRLVHRDNKRILQCDQPLPTSPMDNGDGDRDENTHPDPSNKSKGKQISLATTRMISRLRKASECTTRFDYTSECRDADDGMKDKGETNGSDDDKSASPPHNQDTKSRSTMSDFSPPLSTSQRGALETSNKTGGTSEKDDRSPVKSKTRNRSSNRKKSDIKIKVEEVPSEGCSHEKDHAGGQKSPKRPRGRPPSKKSMSEKDQDVGDISSKRPRGRQPSKKIESEKDQAAGHMPSKRPRGRQPSKETKSPKDTPSKRPQGRQRKRPRSPVDSHMVADTQNVLPTSQNCGDQQKDSGDPLANSKQPGTISGKEVEPTSTANLETCGHGQSSLSNQAPLPDLAVSIPAVTTTDQKRRASTTKSAQRPARGRPAGSGLTGASSIKTGPNNRKKGDKSRRRSKRPNHADSVGINPRTKRNKTSESYVSDVSPKKRLLEYLEHELNWTVLTYDNNHNYYFPPGITKESGKLRRDYFDTITQVIIHLKSSSMWQENLKLRVLVSCCEPHKQREPHKQHCVLNVEQHAMGYPHGFVASWGDWNETKGQLHEDIECNVDVRGASKASLVPETNEISISTMGNKVLSFL